jgi:hypothetical protein
MLIQAMWKMYIGKDAADKYNVVGFLILGHILV